MSEVKKPTQPIPGFIAVTCPVVGDEELLGVRWIKRVCKAVEGTLIVTSDSTQYHVFESYERVKTLIKEATQ